MVMCKTTSLRFSCQYNPLDERKTEPIFLPKVSFLTKLKKGNPVYLSSYPGSPSGCKSNCPGPENILETSKTSDFPRHLSSFSTYKLSCE